MARRKSNNQNSSPIKVNLISFGIMARNFANEIPGIMERADNERLSVFLDQFQAEFPDLYAACQEAIDFPPVVALEHIGQRFPMAIFLRYVPNIENIIAAIQNQLRERKRNGRLLPAKS